MCRAAIYSPQATRSVTLALHVMAEEVRVYHGHITSRQPSMRQSGKWPSQQLGAGQPTPGRYFFPLHQKHDFEVEPLLPLTLQ